MNIGIIGAGNIGTALAVELSQDNVVRLFSTKPELFNEPVEYIDMETGNTIFSKYLSVSRDYCYTVCDADIVFIALPTYLLKSAVENIANYVHKATAIGFIPGAGGIEYITEVFRKSGNRVFALDRVPCVARLEEYGKKVYASKKASCRLAALPSYSTYDLARMISDVLHMEINPMKNVLAVTVMAT